MTTAKKLSIINFAFFYTHRIFQHVTSSGTTKTTNIQASSEMKMKGISNFVNASAFALKKSWNCVTHK